MRNHEQHNALKLGYLPLPTVASESVGGECERDAGWG